MPRTKKFNSDQVLGQVTEIFAKHGFYGVSMSLLVERLAVIRASLYGTFGDKERIYRGCLDPYVQLCPVPRDNSKEITVSDLLEAIHKRYYDHPEVRGCFLLKSGFEVGTEFPEISDLVREYYQEVEKSFKGCLDKHMKTGKATRISNSKEAARYLVNQCFGMHIQAQLSPDPKRARELMNQALALLV